MDGRSAAKEHKGRIAKEADSIQQNMAHVPYPSPQFSPDFSGRPQPTDVVFCRNLSHFVVMSHGFSGATGAKCEAGRLPPETRRPKPIIRPKMT